MATKGTRNLKTGGLFNCSRGRWPPLQCPNATWLRTRAVPL